MTSLPRRALGRTGVEVTALGYGAMELRGAGHRNPRPIEPGQADRVLGAVLDGGIDFIDTAIDYGESEESIGRAIGHRRDEYFLASKVGCLLAPPPDGPRWPHDYAYQNVIDGVHQSLRRLRTDHLDLAQIHLSPSRQTIEDEGTLTALLELRDEGKIRYIGSSSTLPNIFDHIEMGAFDVFQVPYSLLDAAHADAIAAAGRAGAGIIVRGGVAKGEPSTGHGRAEVWDRWEAAGLDELRAPDESRTQLLLLRLTLALPELSTTIVGTLSTDHLAQNLEAAQRGPVSEDVEREARRRVAALDASGV